MSLINKRLNLLEGSVLELFNANTSTLLESMKNGAAGFSGVMANFHPWLYTWLAVNWENEPVKSELLQSVLTICSLIEKQLYPVNAKYHLQHIGLPVTTYTRSKNKNDLTPVFMDEVRQMDRLAEWVKTTLI